MALGVEEAKQFIHDVSAKEALRPKDIMAYETSGECKISEEDFINYYQTIVKTRPSLVRDNLLFVGIRADMKQEPRPGEDDDILQDREKMEDMPRYKLSNNPETFNLLLNLQDYE